MAGNTNKTKGSNAERLYANLFREVGFSFCKTSRQSNRMLDDAGIDLNFLPFNVQIKAGYSSGLNEFKTLQLIRERLSELFPPNDEVHKKIDVLIHRKDVGRGKKREVTDDLVFIWEEDFHRIYEIYNIDFKDFIKVEGQKRGWSFEEHLKIKDYLLYSKDELELVVMSFETFKNLITKIQWE